MSRPPGDENNDCLVETPPQNRLRKRAHASVTNLRSHKRRRSSFAGFSLGADYDFEDVQTIETPLTTTADRFISNRPKAFLPLNVTPRTNRISKKFGLVDDRVLNFKDDIQSHTSLPSSSKNDESTFTLLRKSASSLFQIPPPSRPFSVMENLSKRKTCVLTLDSPGISKDPDAYPISWSKCNSIAVACYNEVYYQDLNTKMVSLLGRTHVGGNINLIEWAGESCPGRYLASGSTLGWVEVWDANIQSLLRNCVYRWRITQEDPAPPRSFSWNNTVLAVGTEKGVISMTDIRTRFRDIKVKQLASMHTSRVLGLEWSHDGTYLASGDKNGVIHVWDRRNGKSLVDVGSSISKIRIGANARAIAWCPWKPELFATGSAAPDGKIQIWSVNSLSAHSPTPLNTISLNTSVLSLRWSPHCKELLSTHGYSYTEPTTRPTSRSMSSLRDAGATRRPRAPKPKITKTPFTNSILVHEYPTCKRLLTLTQAHTSAVTQSCISPDGESIFTVCPREEVIKMWHVWRQRPPAEKEESAFDKFSIR